MALPAVVHNLCFQRAVLDAFSEASVSDVFFRRASELNQNYRLQIIRVEHDIRSLVRNTDVNREGDRLFRVVNLNLPIGCGSQKRGTSVQSEKWD